MCPQDCKEYRRHIAFRDYLRRHDDARDVYGALKQANAEKYRYDIDGYIGAKAGFVRKILEKAGCGGEN